MRRFLTKGTTVLTRAAIAVVAVWFSGAVGAAGLFTPTTGNMTEPRYGHTATALANGKVLLVGGYDGGGAFYLPTADLYDPATGLFSSTGVMTTTPVGRISHRAIKLVNGKVLILGGNDGVTYLATAELYDPTAGTFATTGSMSAMRDKPGAVLLGNGTVLVVGGDDGSGAMGYVATAEIYTPGTGLFTAAAGAMGVARFYPTTTLLADGRVLVTGGSSNSAVLASAEIYDPATGTFAATGSMSAARAGHTATRLADGKVLVSGGLTAADATTGADIYDPASSTFTATSALDAARWRHTSTRLADGKVLVAGGLNNAAFLATAESYAGPVIAAPTSNAGADQAVTSDAYAQANVTLVGTATGVNFPLTYEWSIGATVYGTGTTLNLTLSAGVYTFAFKVTDAGGQTATDSMTVSVALPSGPAGPQGTAGANGAAGAQGIQGIQGLQGLQGPTGPTGAQGAAGSDGSNGTNGTNGAVGATGPQGPQGAAGTNGTNGTNGAVGATGPQGAAGSDGSNGTNGNQWRRRCDRAAGRGRQRRLQRVQRRRRRDRAAGRGRHQRDQRDQRRRRRDRTGRPGDIWF